MATRTDFDVTKIFPEMFARPEPEPTGDGDPAEDYQNVEWMSPKDAGEEWDRISKLLEQNRGFLTGDEVTGEAAETIEWTDWR